MKYLLLFLFWITPLFSFSYKLDVSTNQLSLIDDLQATLALTYPTDYEPDIDAIRRQLLSTDDFIVLEEKILPKEQGSQSIQWTLSPQIPGLQKINLNTIVFRSDTKDPVVLNVDPKTVTVTLPEVNLDYAGRLSPLMTFSHVPTLKIEETDPDKDLKRQQKILASKTLSFGKIAGFVIFLILIALLYYRPTLRKKITFQDPKTAALKRLDQLTKEPTDDFYSELTHTVKRYIENRYQLKTSTSTTQEVLREISTQHLVKQESYQFLQAFLKDAERVKFAHHTPSDQECQWANRSVRTFIEKS